MNIKKVSIIFSLFFCSTALVYASEQQSTLACMAGASADVDGSKSFKSDASAIRFLLTLHKEDGAITYIDLKHSGSLEAMPTMRFKCISDNEISSCSNLGGTLWYYPEKKHGIHASLSVSTIFKEKRANSGGIYNYSCSSF